MWCILSSHPSLPTDVCTAVSDPTCQVSQGVVCDPVVITDECLLTIRRAFDEPGTYCINITLGDDTSQALASALISVNRGESAQSWCGLSVNSFSLWSFRCWGENTGGFLGVLACLEASAEVVPSYMRVHTTVRDNSFPMETLDVRTWFDLCVQSKEYSNCTNPSASQNIVLLSCSLFFLLDRKVGEGHASLLCTWRNRRN